VAPSKDSEPHDQRENENPTEDMVQWAKDRMAAVSETAPGRMGPPQYSEPDSEPHPPDSEYAPNEVKTAPLTKPDRQAKVLVVALDESVAEQGQAYLFDDGQDATHFIESIIEGGLNPHRVIVFRGTPLGLKVVYRAVVTIDEPVHKPTVVSEQPDPDPDPDPGPVPEPESSP